MAPPNAGVKRQRRPGAASNSERRRERLSKGATLALLSPAHDHDNRFAPSDCKVIQRLLQAACACDGAGAVRLNDMLGNTWESPPKCPQAQHWSSRILSSGSLV